MSEHSLVNPQDATVAALRAEVERLRERVADWNTAYWCWVHTGDAGDMARLTDGDTWGAHPALTESDR